MLRFSSNYGGTVAKKRAAELRRDKAVEDIDRIVQKLPDEYQPKRQRISERDGAPDHPRVKEGRENPPNWEIFGTYKPETYQKLETEEQDRRHVPIDRTQLKCELPVRADGDELRGWLLHWRRGIKGALISWAKGRLGAIVYMLARAAEHFEVVDELAHELGLLPKGLTKRAETCMYMCDRLKAAVSVHKWSKCKEQRVDYHVILGSVAPRRVLGDKDPDNMYKRVATELGVSPFGKCALCLHRSPGHCYNIATLRLQCVTTLLPKA